MAFIGCIIRILNGESKPHFLIDLFFITNYINMIYVFSDEEFPLGTTCCDKLFAFLTTSEVYWRKKLAKISAPWSK